jgi:elongation factor P
MISTSDFRNGLKILMDNVPYEITYFQHVKPGKGGAFVRTKLRNLTNQAVVEKTFRAGEKVGKPDISEVNMQYLYSDGSYHFMNLESYEQLAVEEKAVGDSKNFLQENMEVRVLLFNGEVLSLSLPASVELVISKCDPGLKGDTVSGATKPATLETGAVIQVPLFVNEGDKVKVDTRSGEYLERA